MVGFSIPLSFGGGGKFEVQTLYSSRSRQIRMSKIYIIFLNFNIIGRCLSEPLVPVLAYIGVAVCKIFVHFSFFLI